jgi:zinc D-Ala-D-Ala carboxypeptidase
MMRRMGYLSQHFTLEELTHSDLVQRRALLHLSDPAIPLIDNTPSGEIMEHLKVLAGGLERVRSVLGQHPMSIDSGYRCAALNTAVHGAKDSAHLRGYAADFVCPAFGAPLEIVRAIAASGIEFDQCIQEGTWVHISFAPAMRREVLTAHFDGGKATYTQGA